jgi:hypothetical protein
MTTDIYIAPNLDTDRLNFLESLFNRTEYVNKAIPKYYFKTTIHITGPNNCSIYCRDSKNAIVFEAHDETLRATIDYLMIVCLFDSLTDSLKNSGI